MPGVPAGRKSELPQFFAASSGTYAERLVGQLRAAGLDALAEKIEKGKSSVWYVYPLPNGGVTFDNQLAVFSGSDAGSDHIFHAHARRAASGVLFLLPEA